MNATRCAALAPSNTSDATHVTLDARLLRLASLDLTMVRRKLMEPFPEGRGWTEEQALEAEMWYRRYLEITLKYPDENCHVPNGPIDAFWHQHILDTQQYGPDCEHVLGYFLHHYPYFGLNGDEDAANRDRCFDVTNKLYRREFGEDCTQMVHHRKIDAPHSCEGNECGVGGEKVAAVVASKCGGGGSGTGCGQSNCGGSH